MKKLSKKKSRQLIDAGFEIVELSQAVNEAILCEPLNKVAPKVRKLSRAVAKTKKLFEQAKQEMEKHE